MDGHGFSPVWVAGTHQGPRVDFWSPLSAAVRQSLYTTERVGELLVHVAPQLQGASSLSLRATDATDRVIISATTVRPGAQERLRFDLSGFGMHSNTNISVELHDAAENLVGSQVRAMPPS